MRLFFYAAAALSVTIAGAGADPIEDRKNLMKERGSLMRVLAPVAQGQQPFDAATVLDALEKLNANAQAGTDVAALWPAGTESGDTKSAPAIWSNAAGFQAAADKFATDAAAAVEAAPQDLAAFQAVFGPVAGNCGTCHEAFRM
jgi:cytochrome c556